MDFKDHIKQLAKRAAGIKDQIKTEEATKNALIMPFLQSLGYDVFNPAEVEPEFVADVGVKKGEKVDYAILREGEPVIIIECKWWGEDLNTHTTQLYRYFSVTKARFAILTNGIQYKFFSDLEEDNKMDSKPFLEFDLIQLKDQDIDEIKKFHKSYFDMENILDTANEMKMSKEITRIMIAEFKNPSSNFVKYLLRQIYNGKITEKILSLYSPLVKQSINHLINEIVNDKIKSALEKEDIDEKVVEEKKTEEQGLEEDDAPKINTTELELEGYAIIKAMLREDFDVSRISYRDTINYFLIVLDENNRKPICRLWFNAETKKHIGLFDEAKKEIRHELVGGLDDLFKYKEQILNTIKRYDK